MCPQDDTAHPLSVVVSASTVSAPSYPFNPRLTWCAHSPNPTRMTGVMRQRLPKLISKSLLPILVPIGRHHSEGESDEPPWVEEGCPNTASGAVRIEPATKRRFVATIVVKAIAGKNKNSSPLAWTTCT